MTAAPQRAIVAVVVALVALATGPVPVWATPLEDKRADAVSLSTKLDEQARSIVAADKEHRRATAELAEAESTVARAEAQLAAADQRQAEARRLLGLQAQQAYVGGGSVGFLGSLARATVLDVGARRTYLQVSASEDRQALTRLQAAREDLQEKRAGVTRSRQAAADRAAATDGDKARLEKAMATQQALLAKARGDLAVLVAAEQNRRDTEATGAAAAAAAAAVARPPAQTVAAGAPVTATAPKAAPTTKAQTLPVLLPSSTIEGTFACIRQLESGNNYKSPGGGAYQFQDATWHSLGYSGTASDAPPAVQDEAARKLQARDGWAPWTTAALCGRV